MLTRAPLRIPAPTWAALPSREFVVRCVAAALLVTIAHNMEWSGLRYVTSEAVLRLSSLMGMTAERVSPDTLRVPGLIVTYTVSCTFIDVVVGAVAFLWDYRQPLFKETLRIVAIAAMLFALNLVHLQIAQILFALGLPWTPTDGVLGGFAYFAVWLFIWRCRTWTLTAAA